MRGALAVVGAVFYAQVVVLVTMPVAARQAGLAPAAVGLLLAVPGAVSLVLDVPAAALSDARGRRPFVLGGGVLLALGGVALAPAGASPWPWLAGLVLVFTALSLLIAPALAMVTEYVPAERATSVQGLNGTIQAAVSMAASLVAGALLGLSLVQVSFLTVAAAGVVIAAIGLTLPSATRHRDRPAITIASRSYRRGIELLRGRPVQLAGLLAVAYGTLFLVVGNAFLPSFAIGLGIPPVLVGVLLAARTGVVAITSATLHSVVARRGLIVPVVLLTLIGAVGAIVVPIAVVVPGLLIAAIALQGLGIGYSVGASNLWITSGTTPEARAVAIATTNVGSRLVLLLLAPLLAVAADVQPAAPFVVGGLLVAATAALMWRIHERGLSITPLMEDR